LQAKRIGMMPAGMTGAIATAVVVDRLGSRQTEIEPRIGKAGICAVNRRPIVGAPGDRDRRARCHGHSEIERWRQRENENQQEAHGGGNARAASRHSRS
jgi:hypothetical protein